MDSVKRKEPWVAILLSLILPGLGHAYTGRAKRGLVLFGLGIAGEALILAYFWHPSTRIELPFAIIAIGFSIGFVLHLLIDAYRSAKVWNAQHAVPRIPFWRRLPLVGGTLVLLVVASPGERILRHVTLNVMQTFEVLQYSMEPTLMPMDRVLVNKRIYRRSDPQRGDIVVHRYPRDRERLYIKRIVGLPGETVEIRAGQLLLNGVVFRTPARWATLPQFQRGLVPLNGGIAIPEGHYFVLGDNTANSEDSRAFGPIPRADVLGKAYKIYYPFERSGPLE